MTGTLRAALALCFLIAPAPLFAADSVVNMCTADGRSRAACECAAGALRDDIGPRNYALYKAIGADYVEHRRGGLEAADAWRAAVRSAGTTSGEADPLGAAHRAAIRGCGA
ncbi:MAG: hypothetical protein AAFR35_07025 [Pseudomonadota bacterium]